MAEIKASPSEVPVVGSDRPNTLKLHNWAQQHCVPLDYIYSDFINKGAEGRWSCSIGVTDKEETLASKRAATKMLAKELAAGQFFELKADVAILKHHTPLPAPTLDALCAKLCVPRFRIESDQLDPGKLALSQAMMVIGAVKDAGDKVHYQSRARLAKKQAARTVASSEYWAQCTISHALWAPGTRIVGAGPTIKKAVHSASVRVLRQCMDDDRMFKNLVLPDAPTLKNINDIFIGDGQHRLCYSFEATAVQLDTAFGRLGKSSVLGLDTEHVADPETKQHRVESIQLTGDDLTLVYHRCLGVDFRDRLSKILQNPNQLKFVVDLPREQMVLQAAGFKLKGAVDLQAEAKKYPQFADKASLVMMAARLCHLRLDRDSKIRQSDWAAVPLSEEQIHYAGLDSFTTLIVGLSFQARAKAAPSDPMFLRWNPEEGKGKDMSETKKTV